MQVIDLAIQAVHSPLFMLAGVASSIAFILRVSNSWNVRWGAVIGITTIVWIIAFFIQLAEKVVDEQAIVRWTVSLLALVLCYFFPLGVYKLVCRLGKKTPKVAKEEAKKNEKEEKK
jgi:hypothetical protein